MEEHSHISSNLSARKSMLVKENDYIQAKKELEQGNLEESLIYINLAINKSEKALYFFFRGNVHEKLNDMENCYKDFKKAKDLNSSDFVYYENLGRICKELKKYEEAIDNYTEIIESGIINDDDTLLANYHYEIGSIYDMLNNHEDSYIFYSQAIDLDNKLAVNYQFKGNYLHECKEFKSKLYELLETSYFYDVNSSKIFIDNDTERPSLNNKINRENLELKILNLQKEIEENPFEKSLWEKIGKSLKEAKRFEEAVKYYQKCHEKQRKNKLYLINLADCYLKLKNYWKAILFADKLVELDTTYFKTYKIRSIAYYEINDMEKSLENINKAINIQPDNYFSKEFRKKIQYNLERGQT